jgi:antitoxin PrlF
VVRIEGNAIALTAPYSRITITARFHRSKYAVSATLQAESTLTDRYQTTVPETVRRALRLGKRDKIHYTIRPDGEVVLTRAGDDDPALAPFLDFLARDMVQRPERLKALDADFAQRIQALVGGVEVDLDAPLSAEDD